MSTSHAMIDMDVAEESARFSLHEDSASNPCKLCLDEIQAGKKFHLQSCGCFFCVDCMKSYVEVLVTDGVALTISCPDAECVVQGRLQLSEVSSLINGDLLETYYKLREEQEVAVNPYQTFCPTPDCSTICYIPVTRSHSTLKKVRNLGKKLPPVPSQVFCPKCVQSFCHICKAKWTDKHKCKEQEFNAGNMELGIKTNAKLASSRSDAVIKRCPVCSILIEKDRGCGQMICKNCSHVFCWHCLKLLDNDFMLRHYDKGPCRKYLGHTRSQVFRHRLGVIGLFAAFCILVLAVSPILLLAAPIFLCCKWKECCERAWHRAQIENSNALFAELQATPDKVAVDARNRNGSQSSATVILPNQVVDSIGDGLTSVVIEHPPPSTGNETA